MSRQSDAGISLLELLLSLAILSTVAVVSASLVETGRRVWDRTDGQEARADQMVAIEMLRDWLEALPSDEDEAAPIMQLWGNNKEIGFYVGAERIGRVGSQSTKVHVRRNEDGELTILVGSEESGFEREWRQLTGRLSQLTVRYFHRTGGAGVWVSSWDRPALPELVKIEMKLPNGTALPPITVRPAKLSRQRYVSRSSLVPPG